MVAVWWGMFCVPGCHCHMPPAHAASSTGRPLSDWGQGGRGDECCSEVQLSRCCDLQMLRSDAVSAMRLPACIAGTMTSAGKPSGSSNHDSWCQLSKLALRRSLETSIRFSRHLYCCLIDVFSQAPEYTPYWPLFVMLAYLYHASTTVMQHLCWGLPSSAWHKTSSTNCSPPPCCSSCLHWSQMPRCSCRQLQD